MKKDSFQFDNVINTPLHAQQIFRIDRKKSSKKRASLQLLQNSFHDLAVNRPLLRRFNQNRSRSGVHHPENGEGGSEREGERRDKDGIRERNGAMIDGRQRQTRDGWRVIG